MSKVISDIIDKAKNKAKNTNITEVLCKLAKDEYYNVIEYVANNHNIPPKILAKLAKCKDPYIRESVSKNYSTPPEVLAILATDSYNYIRIRELVAEHPNTSPEILEQLSKDEDNYVRRAIAKNPTHPLKFYHNYIKIKIIM
jgi:hypothetical protein